MTEAEIVIIGKLIDVCRAKRVRVLENDGFRIELDSFGPELMATPTVDAKPMAPAVDETLCRCGHPEHMHQNGLCLAACSEAQCAGPVKP